MYHDPQSPEILLPGTPQREGIGSRGQPRPRTPSAQVTRMSWQNLFTMGWGWGQLLLFPSTDKDTKAQRGEAEPYWEPVLRLAGRGTQATSLGTRVWAPLSLLARLQGGSLAEGSVPCPC